MFRAKLLRTTALCGAIGVSGAAQAASDMMGYAAPATPLAQLPAVDGVNGKLSAAGGGGANGGLGFVNGSLSIPLAPAFGDQFDASVGDFAGSGYGAIADHAFWRNPAVGLLGVYGDYERLNGFGGVNIGYAAAEGEGYFGKLTLRAVAGAEFANAGLYNGGTLQLNARTRFFDKADIVWFLNDDTSLFVGHRYTGGLNAAALGAEHLFHLGGTAVSAFAEARLGENNYRAAWGGVRIYFGGSDKNLIRRTREDDPTQWTSDSALALANNKNHIATSPPPSPPPPPPPPPPPHMGL